MLVGEAGVDDDLRLRLSDRELRVARDLSRPERYAQPTEHLAEGRALIMATPRTTSPVDRRSVAATSNSLNMP